MLSAKQAEEWARCTLFSQNPGLPVSLLGKNMEVTPLLRASTSALLERSDSLGALPLGVDVQLAAVMTEAVGAQSPQETGLLQVSTVSPIVAPVSFSMPDKELKEREPWGKVKAATSP